MRFKPLLGCCVVLWATVSVVWAQPAPCHCPDNLQQLVASTEANYAGYPTKIRGAAHTRYQALLLQLRRQAATAATARQCYEVLKAYVRFFYDKHFVLSFAWQAPEPPEQRPIEEWRRLLARAPAHSPEGIWQDADSSLQLAIRYTHADTLKAVVLWAADTSLRPGMRYATLSRRGTGWVAQEHHSLMTTDVPAAQRGQLLQIWYHSLFAKQYPTRLSAAESEELATWRQGNNGLAFRQLSARTAYLRIPTFIRNDDKVLALIQQHDAANRQSEFLIIDLRSNGGGNTGWVPLLPYLMTQPIRQYSTYLRVSPANVQAKLADLEPFATAPIPDEYKKYFPDSTLAAYKKAYRELPTTRQAFYPIPGVSFPLDSVLVRPRRVAVLVDEWCGSSTEYFFSLLRQSGKVVTYGAPTIGMMDYEGMSIPTPMPYAGFVVAIPIVKSSWTDRAPIDKTGFRPTRLLTHLSDRRQWVDAVRKDLEKQ